MKSNVNSKSVFSATLSLFLITGIVALVIILIQLFTSLSTLDYNIASLNILGAYIFDILLSSTSQLSKKISIT